MKKNLYVISGVTGMTGSELARQLLARGEAVFGFDNFFASSIDTVCDILDDTNFVFCEYNIKNPRIVFKGVRSADPVRRLLNTEKIRRITNWSPVVPLSAGLDMCIAHIRGEHE